MKVSTDHITNENHSHLCLNVSWHNGQIDRTDRIEYAWVNGGATVSVNKPLLVFLHEGLGSVALWREFPKHLCKTLSCKGLVFSRQGYGRSTAREPDEHWTADFMHWQAQSFLPAFLEGLGVNQPIHLLGHSDGGTIALLYAAMYPDRVNAAVVLAPHVFVEQICVDAIAAAKVTYETDCSHPQSMRKKLSKYHADVDSAFYGWCDVWLSEAFRSFDMRDWLPKITCPVLAIQGHDDAYGTMAQVDDIARLAAQTKRLKLGNCAHSPHIDQPLAVLEACKMHLC